MCAYAILILFVFQKFLNADFQRVSCDSVFVHDPRARPGVRSHRVEEDLSSELCFLLGDRVYVTICALNIEFYLLGSTYSAPLSR